MPWRLIFQHVARSIVERIENVALDAFGPTRIFKNFFRSAKVNIEVNQRAAADATRLNHINLFERAIIQQPEVFVVPERARNLSRSARKIFLAPALAALEDADRSACLRQTTGINRSAKTGADDHHVVAFFHVFERSNPMRKRL